MLPILFLYNGNPLLACCGNFMDFWFKTKTLEALDFEIFVFSHIFSLLWEFTFPIFLEFYGFLLHPKYLRNPLSWNVCFFLILFRIMEFHFSHILGIVWISASSKVFKNTINLKCLCFPILFPDYGNPLFPCVGNCMDFCFKQKVPETFNFEMFMFSHIFFWLWKFIFLIFLELYVLTPHLKYVRNP